MQNQELGDENEHNLNIEVFVDMDPSTICTLVECGELNKGQLLALTKLSNKDAVQAVFTTIKDSFLEELLMDSNDFQPFLDVVVDALGEDDLRSRVTRWLVDASKTQAKQKVVHCSRIVRAIVSRKSTPTTAFLLPSASGRLPDQTAQTGLSQAAATAAQPTSRQASPPHPVPQSHSHAQTPASGALSGQPKFPPKPRSPTPMSPRLNAEQTPVSPVHRSPPTAQPFPFDAQTPSQHVPRGTNPSSPKSPSPRKRQQFKAPPSAAEPPAPPNTGSNLDSLPQQSNPLPTPNVIEPDLALRNLGSPSNSGPARPQGRTAVVAETGATKSRGPSGRSNSAGPDDPESESGTTVPPVDELLDGESPEDALGEAEQDADAEEPANEGLTAFPPSGNPWDVATNDERVKKWKLEEEIHANPRHTSPFRTQWMYEDRKTAMEMNDAEYKVLTDQEYSKFLKVPPAMRGHAGLVFNKKSKFDWEIRVVLGKLAYDYSQMDEPENATLLSNALVELEVRFPDISPAHVFRNINKEGKKAVRKWWSDVAKWVQTTAGKMGAIKDELEHHVEMLDAKKPSKKYDVYKLLGLKRAEVNYVAWGKTEGLSKCEPLIKAEMDVWKADPVNQKAMEEDGKVFGQERVQVEARIRQKQFDKLTKEEKDQFLAKNNSRSNITTDQEIQGAAESLLSHLIHVGGHAAKIGDLHIVLMASGYISGGRLPVVIKEFGVKPEHGPFINDQEVGGRASKEYQTYAASRFKADPTELEIFDKGLEDGFSATGQGSSKSRGKGKGKAKASTGSSAHPQPSNTAPDIPKQSTHQLRRSFASWTPAATVNTDRKRAEYLSRFLGSTFKNNFSIQLSWNNISANNERFVEGERRPKDANNQPVLLMNPTAMPVVTHLKPWWDFMQNCAKGLVPDNEVFSWKPETTRLKIPTIPAPENPELHVSGELSRTANPKKRPRRENAAPARKSRKLNKSTKPASQEPELELEEDLDGLIEDADNWGWGEEEEVAPTRTLRSRRESKVSSAVPSVYGDDDEGAESGTDGSEFTPETKGEVEAAVSDGSQTSRLSGKGAPRSRNKALRVLSPSLLDFEQSDVAQSGSDGEAVVQPEEQPPAKSPQKNRSHSSASPTSSSEGSSKIPGIALAPISSEGRQLASTIASTPDDPPHNFTSNNAANAKLSREPTSVRRAPSPVVTQPFAELRIGHPRMFNGEASASGSPGWLQIKPLLSVWGSKISFLDMTQCDIFHSPAPPKSDLALPSAVTSAISIMQIFLAMQLADPHRPDTPLVRVSPTCGLDAVHPHHHLRQIVEGILDVQLPLPSSKLFEANMLLKPEGIRAFFGTLEEALVSFVDDLTANEAAIRYSEIEFFTALRLALYIKGTTLIRDEASTGPSAERVASILDRLVSVLAGVAALRYMQEYLGEAASRWCREDCEKGSARWYMWFSVGQLWKAGMAGLASALSQKRQDLFQFRGIDDVISPSVRSIVELLMVNPAWWSPLGDGVPVAFTVGIKQFIPSESLFNRLANLPWARLSFIDRSSVLLALFICAIQLSQEPDGSPRLIISSTDEFGSLMELFTMRCSDLRRCIEENGSAELGPKYARDESEDEVRRRQTNQAWVSVWTTERGPQAADPLEPSTSSAAEQEESAPESQAPGTSQASSIVAATPSAVDEHEADPSLERVVGLPAIAEEDEPQSAEVPREADDSDVGVMVLGPARGKRKRKVAVGGRQTAEPSVGVAENPRRRLRKAAESAAEEEPPERSRRQAYLKSPYVSAPPPALSSAAPKASSPKKPRAAVAKESSSPKKLTQKQRRVEAARKASAAKAAKKAASSVKGKEVDQPAV
ncbi:hypothetical protein M407DRAFT_31239 [Tulasnella calospora MUT 4182]|uniref:Uncharacterized protein n=1 Tax=Tulasnella calospora MUT 4182 TaxID=1051891 RepID=A0A0C3LC99_9AGAM|nr:hypothetical protein M407DRAFT_31239 [Tulasnella calospora MUT 4182]